MSKHLASFFVVLIIAIYSPKGNSYPGDSMFRLGSGVLSLNALKNTTNADASTSIVGTNYYLPIYFQVKFSLLEQTFTPTVLYTPIPLKSPESGSSTKVLMVTLPWAYQVSDSIELTAGPGYMVRSIIGKGGTVQLSNGLGTSTFSLPSRTEQSTNMTADFGIEWEHNEYAVALNAILTSLFSDRRSVSFLLTFNRQL